MDKVINNSEKGVEMKPTGIIEVALTTNVSENFMDTLLLSYVAYLMDFSGNFSINVEKGA